MNLPDRVVECVDLLHQLHSALPDLVDERLELFLACDSLLEPPVESSLRSKTPPKDKSSLERPQMEEPPGAFVQAQLAAFSKFSTLWHVGRETHAKLGNSLRLSDIFWK